MSDSPDPHGMAPGDVFGHPRGLAYLAGTELWERISFHGMQALLVLYMAGTLLLPGHVERIVGFPEFRAAIEGVTGPLSVQALASQIFGLYIGLVYFTPAIGGWLGDRVLGRRTTVVLGGLLMTGGHFAMAFDQSFLLALLLLIAGAGCLRGNLSAQIDGLYAPGDRRRADAFQIYFTALNLGAFIAPIVSGLLGQTQGWHFAFGFAGVGMVIGLVVYLAGTRYLPRQQITARAARDPLNPDERRRVVVLASLLPVSMLFWVAQTQVWNVYNLWVRDRVDLDILGWTMPVPWLQAIDGLAPAVTMPVMVLLWRWQAARGREPDDIGKLAIGCFLFAAGAAWLAAAPLATEAATGRVPLLWAIGFHLISNLGWLYYVPTIAALFVRTAPPAVKGTMLGATNLAVFAGSLVSGRIGGLYEQLSNSEFWGLHAVIVAVAGAIFLLAGPWLRRAAAPRAILPGFRTSAAH